MAELIEADQKVQNLEEPVAHQSLLNVISEELDGIKDKWREIGEVLKVSKKTLDELQSLDEGGVNHKENFEVVMKEWIEKNMSTYMWPPLLQALNNIQDLDPNLLDLERLSETYGQNDADSPNSDDGDRDSTEDDNNRNDPQGGDNDNATHRDGNHPSKCQQFSRCCCCPCRQFTRCCKMVGQHFRKGIRCLGKCRYLYCIFHVALVSAIVGMALRAAEYPESLDELDRLLLEDQSAADKLSEIGSRSISILVTGKTGTGKSALINGIIGVNVSKEGGLLDPTTSEVEKYARKVRGVQMFVYDSPGLQDGTKNEKAYLLDMEKKCKTVDLVLYTVRMSDQRVNVGDIEAMKKLTIAFGEKFWGRAMFVLTFANEVRDPKNPEDDTSNHAFFEERLRVWKDKLPGKVMKELNITKKIAKGIPIIPAGYYKNPHLPDRRYWFSQFWRAMLDRMKEYTADGYTFLLQFNKDRFKRAYETTTEDFQKDIYKQPILMARRSSTSGAHKLCRGYLFIISFTLVSIGSYAYMS